MSFLTISIVSVRATSSSSAIGKSDAIQRNAFHRLQKLESVHKMTSHIPYLDSFCHLNNLHA